MKKYRFSILAILFFFASFTGCKSVESVNSGLPKYRHIKGVYYRNIAEGWRRPDANTEVIPDIPHYQVLILGKFRKFKLTDFEGSIARTGHWKIKKDTLVLKYKTKTIEKYYIDMPYIRNGACLQDSNPKIIAFCRSNEDLVKKYEKPRSISEINKYENGNIESSGIVKYFYNKPDDKTKKRVGEWLFFDENEELLRITYYVRGKKVWTKNYQK